MVLFTVCKYFLTFVFSIVFLALSIIYFSLPNYSGSYILSQEGFKNDYGNFNINRDEFGIPHIMAKSYIDALFGMGWTHSQDRLYSMHIKRLFSSGRISEMAGKDGLETDKFFRSVGISRLAEQYEKTLNNNTRQLIQAYCDGVNSQVKQMKFLPMEFWITWQSFDDWKISDVYRVSLLMNLFLATDYLLEPFKDLVKQKYGKDFAQEVFAGKNEYLFDNTSILSDDDLKKSNLFVDYQEFQKQKQKKQSDNYDQSDIPSYIMDGFAKLTQIEALEDAFLGLKGSNSWVVSGNHTKTGKPILANDPHLEINIPSFWYQNEIIFKQNGVEQFIIGAAAPGIPGIFIGRNNFMSWGLTNNFADTTDLYLEKFHKNGSYFYEGRYLEMKKFDEIIYVRGQREPIKFTSHRTHHGAVLENLYDITDQLKPFSEYKGLSLSWTGFQKEDLSIGKLLNFMRCENLQEFKSNLSQYDGVILNLIYATTDNHIGYLNIGHLPVRNNPENIFILDGTKKENDWVRFYNDSENPRVDDPKKGFIVTANNKMSSDNLVNHITANSISHSRALRITQMIEEKIIGKNEKLNVDDFKIFQMDTLDAYCEKAMPSFLNIFEKYLKIYIQKDLKFQQKKSQTILDFIYGILKEWPCRMDTKGNYSLGATFYGVWEQKFLTKLMRNVHKKQYFNDKIVMNFWFDQFIFRKIVDWANSEKNINLEFCKNLQNEHSNMSCIFNFFEAFEETYQFLIDKLGRLYPNHTNWSYGQVVDHVFVHNPFSKTPLKHFFQRERLGYGNKRTVNLGGTNFVSGLWKSIYSANYRTIISMDENDKSYYILDTGISENLLSKHYDDQLDLFYNGQYIEMKWGSNNLKQLQFNRTLEIQFKSKEKSARESDF